MADPTLAALMPQPPRKRKLWPRLAVAAAAAVLVVTLIVIGTLALRSSDAEPAAAPTPSASAEIRVGQPCSGHGRTATTVAGTDVRCEGGAWQPAAEPTTPAPLPPPPPADNTAAVGGTFTVTDSEGLEAEYTLTKTITKTRDEFGDRPKRGIFLLVHVRVVVKSESEFACSCSFQFVTTAGKVYEAHYATFSGYEEFASADLAGGQNSDGWIPFDVPKAALKGGRIGFKPNSFDGEIAYWRL